MSITLDKLKKAVKRKARKAYTRLTCGIGGSTGQEVVDTINGIVTSWKGVMAGMSKKPAIQ